MTTRSTDLPDYKQPPVSEVAFSYQYQQDIPNFSMAHAGRFWAELAGEFPHLTEAPPIQAKREAMDGTLGEVTVEMSDLPPPRRIQLAHRSEGWLLQFQPDRFILNWRQNAPDAEYPRFGPCYERFLNYRTQFEGFCADAGLKVPAPNQYELTYVNHVDKGEFWNSLEQIGSIFPDLAWRGEREFLGVPKVLSWSAAFDMPESAGRLHASVKLARRKSDNKELLILELTARGFINDSNATTEKDWFLLGREWIVRGFADLTHMDIQNQVWGRIS